MPASFSPAARVRAAALALGALPLAASAQSNAPGAAPQVLDPVVVNADPLDRTEPDALRPVTVVRGDDLRAKESTNLGATLSRELGVHSSAYGPGAGRPIVRGMDSARVAVTESGLGVGDVSGVSPDHRVAADTLTSRQVEVLRGPATLLYGSGAIGGLVNVVSDRVPRLRPDDLDGSINLRGSTAERERAAAFALDGPLGAATAWRADGFRQQTSDYDLAEPLRDADGNVIAADRLPNSQTDTQALAVGAAWFGPNGTRLGAALQRYESDYGIPNPEEPVTIELRRSRLELNGDSGAFGPFAGLRSRFGFTDYKHTEFEPTGEAGATFTSRGGEGRFELPLAFSGDLSAVVGAQISSTEVRGAGEGQLPRTDSTAASLFAIGERKFGALRVELGARVENARHKVDEDYEDGTRAPSRSFTLATGSGAVAWRFAPAWELGTSVTLSQRAPATEELYFLGAHPATFAFEIGDPNLRKEKSTNVELSLRRNAGPVRAKLNVFLNRVRDYIYGAFDGSTTDILDENGNVEETLSNLFYRQADARLHGAEAELTFGAEGPKQSGPTGRLWADTVRGKLTSGEHSGENLPRMAPARVGFSAGWHAPMGNASVSVTRVMRQKRTSSFDLRDGEPESVTAGYTTVDAGVSWRVRDGATPVMLYLLGRNLTDADIRVHTSFLKNTAPPPGRSFVVGLRAAF